MENSIRCAFASQRSVPNIRLADLITRVETKYCLRPTELDDDRSKSLRKYRLIGLTAVIPVLICVALIALSPAKEAFKIVYAIVYLPAVLASYYNLKHLVLPDVDLGIISCMRRYNLFMLITTAVLLVNTVFKVYGLTAPYGVSNMLVGVMGALVVVSAKRSAERWFS